MSFEAALLIKAFFAPLVVSSFIAWLWNRYARKAATATLGRRILVGLAWWLGSLIVLAIQVQSLRFDETWQQADYFLWIVALAACITSQKIKAAGVWLLAGLLVVVVLYASLPRGDGWNDVATTKYCWWSLGVIAWLVNSRFWPGEIQEAGTTSNGWLVWTLLVYQSALAICAFSCYASLGEWSLNLVAITIPFASLASKLGVGSMRSIHWQVFAAGSLIAISAVLYGADPWAVAVALFMPTFVGVLDSCCPLLTISRMRRIWIVMIGTSLMLLVIVILLSAS